MKRWVRIAIDGPSGVGKSTLSRLLAGKLGLRYVDTGAMYRALALALSDGGVSPDDEVAIRRFCSSATFEYSTVDGSVKVNGKDYTGRIRTQEAGELASVFSAKKAVREFLTRYQRSLGEAGSVVMEGRDIGTVVLPDADVKFFLEAPIGVRAERRRLELSGASVKKVNEEIDRRDRRDATRESAPLKKADDAVSVDTGSLGVEEVLEVLLKHVREKTGVGNISR